MAGRGPTPKDPDKRQRRNATQELTELQLGGSSVKAPALPGAKKFLKATRDWYAIWASSPQASQFTMPSWQRLWMLAPLVDQYFRAPDKTLLAEIRLNEKELGATPEAMQRLRWRPPARAAGQQEGASNTTARRRRRGDPRLKLVQGGAPK